jgi:anti-sigma B factor antagonist
MAKGDVLFRQEGILGLLDFPRDVTAQTRETAYSAYNELARARVRTLALNFASTDYMNSAGIGLIISLVEDATQAGRNVYAFGLTSHYRKLFNYAGLMERVTLAADEQDVKTRIIQETTAAPASPTASPPAPTTPPSSPATT